MDGIDTDVWIGQTGNTTYEWYYMSGTYEQIGISSRLPKPILIVKTDTVFNTVIQSEVRTKSFIKSNRHVFVTYFSFAFILGKIRNSYILLSILTIRGC